MTKSLYLLIIYCNILGYSIFLKKILLKQKISKRNSLDLLFGIIFLYFISLFLNFFIPLKIISVPLFITGILLFFFFKKISFNYISKELIIIIFIVAIMIEAHSVAADTHLYHLQIIKWYSIEKSVFGLANLENRFGLVSGWQHLLSIYNFEIYQENLLYLINSIPFIILLLLIFEICKSKLIKHHDIFLFLIACFLLVYGIIHPTLNGTIFNTMGSADADSAGSYFFIISFFIFIKLLNKYDDYYLYLLFISITLSILAKISNLFLFLLPLFLIYNYKINIFNKNKNLFIFLLFTAILWIAKHFITSGCLIFPAEFTCFYNFEWSVPKSVVNDFVDLSKSFPRSKNNYEIDYSNHEYYLNSYKWFTTWFFNFFITNAIVQIYIILSLFSLICIFIFFKSIKKIYRFYHINFFIIFFGINIFYWLQAPDIRYAYGILNCLVIFLLSYFVYMFSEKFDFILIKTKYLLFILFTLMIIKNIPYQFQNNLFAKNRTYNYSHIKLIKYINGKEIYITSSGNCSFFEKICLNNQVPENLNLVKKNKYLFISQ